MAILLMLPSLLDVDDRHYIVLHSWHEQLLKQFEADSAIVSILDNVPFSTLLVPIQ